MHLPLLACLLLAPLPWRGALLAQPSYRATVGADGHLASLRVGAAEALDPLGGASAGALLDGGVPVAFAHFLWRQATVSSSGSLASLSLRADADQLQVSVLNACERPLTFEVHLAPAWELADRQATAPWGARLALTTRAEANVERHAWRIVCRPFESTALALSPTAAPAPRPLAQALWVEPRGVPVGQFVLPASAPALSPDGRWLNVPLQVANDSGEARSVSLAASLSDDAGHPLGSSLDSVDLPDGTLTPFDARLGAPPPGVYRLTVEVAVGGQRLPTVLTLAYAPERWPLAALPAPVADSRTASLVPPASRHGWQRCPLRLGGEPAGEALLSPTPGPALLLAGWPLDELETLARERGPALALRDGVGVAAASQLLVGWWHPARWGLAVAASESWPAVAPACAALWQPARAVPDWPGRPRLVGWCVTPDSPARTPVAWSPELDARIYTVAPEMAREHFRAVQRGWLAQRLRPLPTL